MDEAPLPGTAPRHEKHALPFERVVLVMHRALEILESIKPLAEGNPAAIVFQGVRGRPLSEVSMLRMCPDGVTVHGFRSSFRDWAGDKTPFPREIAEAALAHVAGDETERAYLRSDALEKRRNLLEAWAAFCTSPPPEGRVINLATRASRDDG
jgi:integrase